MTDTRSTVRSDPAADVAPSPGGRGDGPVRAGDRTGESRPNHLRPDGLELLEPLAQPIHIAAGAEIDRAGERYRRILLIRDGWAAMYKLLPNGRRQILDFMLPGDMIGLNVRENDRAPFSIAALTNVAAWAVDWQRICQETRRRPDYAARLRLAAGQQNARLCEHLVSLGRRTAQERLATLLFELHERLHRIGRAANGRFEFPITQTDIGDALGLTNVHVSRTLGDLRKNRLIRTSPGAIAITDPARFAEIAGCGDSDRPMEVRQRAVQHAIPGAA